MNEKLKEELERALRLLEEAEEKIKTPGVWNATSQSIAAISELIKEQIGNEDPRHSAGPAR
jgi:hypothetical protein